MATENIDIDVNHVATVALEHPPNTTNRPPFTEQQWRPRALSIAENDNDSMLSSDILEKHADRSDIIHVLSIDRRLAKKKVFGGIS